MQSILRRGLAVLDAEGRTHYYTSGFEPEAMEERGVWRFAVRRDARLFATGRREAVLAGDERAFVITRDLGSMTVENGRQRWRFDFGAGLRVDDRPVVPVRRRVRVACLNPAAT